MWSKGSRSIKKKKPRRFVQIKHGSLFYNRFRFRRDGRKSTTDVHCYYCMIIIGAVKIDVGNVSFCALACAGNIISCKQIVPTGVFKRRSFNMRIRIGYLCAGGEKKKQKPRLIIIFFYLRLARARRSRLPKSSNPSPGHSPYTRKHRVLADRQHVLRLLTATHFVGIVRFDGLANLKTLETK